MLLSSLALQKNCIKEICCCCLPVTPDQICLAVIVLTIRTQTGRSACFWPHTWWAAVNVLQDSSSEAMVCLTGKQCIIYIKKEAGVWNQSPRVPTLSKHWMKGVEELKDSLSCPCLSLWNLIPFRRRMWWTERLKFRVGLGWRSDCDGNSTKGNWVLLIPNGSDGFGKGNRQHLFVAFDKMDIYVSGSTEGSGFAGQCSVILTLLLLI